MNTMTGTELQALITIRLATLEQRREREERLLTERRAYEQGKYVAKRRFFRKWLKPEPFDHEAFLQSSPEYPLIQKLEEEKRRLIHTRDQLVSTDTYVLTEEELTLYTDTTLV